MRWQDHITTATLVTGAGAGGYLAAPTIWHNLDDHAGLVLLGACLGLLAARRWWRRRRQIEDAAVKLSETAQTVEAVDRALSAGWQARTGNAPPLRLVRGQGCDDAAGDVSPSRCSRYRVMSSSLPSTLRPDSQTSSTT